MGDTTVVTHHYGNGKVLEFQLKHERPIDFYVVEPSDEDRLIIGSYSVTQNDGGAQEILDALIATLSDLSIIVEKMTACLLREPEEARADGSGRTQSALYTCGMIKT